MIHIRLYIFFFFKCRFPHFFHMPVNFVFGMRKTRPPSPQNFSAFLFKKTYFNFFQLSLNRKITFVPYSKFLVGYYFSTPYASKLFLSARCIPKLCIFQTFGMTTTKLVINGLKFSAVLKESKNNSVILFGDSLTRNFQMTEIDKVCLPGGRCQDFKAVIQSVNFSRHRVAIFLFGGNDLESRFKGIIWRQRLSPQEITQEIMEIAFFIQ